MVNLNVKSLDELDPVWCCWLIGLVDGEGSPQLKYQKERYWMDLSIKLRDDEKPMLDMIRHTLGRGHFYWQPTGGEQLKYSRPQCVLRFHSAADIRFLIALFERYPLRSKKKHIFPLWAQARKELDKPPLTRDLSYLKYLHKAIRAARQYAQPLIEPYKPEGIQLSINIEKEAGKER